MSGIIGLLAFGPSLAQSNQVEVGLVWVNGLTIKSGLGWVGLGMAQNPNLPTLGATLSRVQRIDDVRPTQWKMHLVITSAHRKKNSYERERAKIHGI